MSRDQADEMAKTILRDFYAFLSAAGPMSEDERKEAIYTFVRGCLKASAEAAKTIGLTWIDHVATAGCEGYNVRTSVTEGESKMHILLHFLSLSFPDGNFPAPDLPLRAMDLSRHDHDVPASELN